MPKTPARRPPVTPPKKPAGRTAGLQLMMAATVIDSMKRRGASGRLGKQYGDKRDMYNVLGYLRVPTVEDYWQMFLRQDVAKRIIKAPVNATWRQPPLIRETANPARDTKFEKAWDELEKQLKVWSYFARADRLAGVGYYGVLLIGTAGELKTAVAAASKTKIQDVFFLSSFSQRHARVKSFVDDPKNARFGRPLNYEINLTGDLASGLGRSTPARKTLAAGDDIVDASRVIHLAEELTEDEVHGTPRLEAVVNRLYDLEKIAGGSAEMYWRGAYGGFALEVAENATSAFAGSGEIDEDVVDEFAHGMRRWIDLEGYKLHEITSTDIKPKEVFDVTMDLISSATSIPARILKGSERGELASSQDETNWNKVIQDRQREYATPIVREFIDRMILWGVLPAPAQYEVIWPDLFLPSTAEKAKVFLDTAQAIAAVAPPGAPDLIISPTEVRTKFLDLEAQPDEAPDIPPMDPPVVNRPMDRTTVVNVS